MVPNPIVDSYIDYTDAFSMYKRKGLGYGIEPEGCPRVGEHIHLRWQDENKCYPCRIVYYNPGKYYTTVIYCKHEQYTTEYVSMRKWDWHYIIDAHMSKRGEDLYDPTAQFGRILFFNDVPLGASSDFTTPPAYVCEYLPPTNDICLHQNLPCKQNTTIWLQKVIIYRTSAYETTEMFDLLKQDSIVIG